MGNREDKEPWRTEGDSSYTQQDFLKGTLQKEERKYLKDMNYPEWNTNLGPQAGEANRKNKFKSMLRH